MAAETDLGKWEYQKLADLRYQIRRFLRFSEEAAWEERLETQQHQFLLAIRAHGGGIAPTVGELAERLLIRHHSAVGLADRLAERGMVRRLTGERDRRCVHVELTEAGEGVLARLAWLHREELQQFGPQLVEALQATIQRTGPVPPSPARCTIEKRA